MLSYALDEAGSKGTFLASLNVFKWWLILCFNLMWTVLVVAPHADGKNLLLADGGVRHGNDDADYLCVLFNLCFNYVQETSSPYSLALLVFRGNTQLDHFSIRNWFGEPSAGWSNVFNDADFRRIKSLSSKWTALTYLTLKKPNILISTDEVHAFHVLHSTAFYWTSGMECCDSKHPQLEAQIPSVNNREKQVVFQGSAEELQCLKLSSGSNLLSLRFVNL